MLTRVRGLVTGHLSGRFWFLYNPEWPFIDNINTEFKFDIYINVYKIMNKMKLYDEDMIEVLFVICELCKSLNKIDRYIYVNQLADLYVIVGDNLFNAKSDIEIYKRCYELAILLYNDVKLNQTENFMKIKTDFCINYVKSQYDLIKI